jgi:transposase
VIDFQAGELRPTVTVGEKYGWRTYGKSKDSRDNLPQIVIGMAMTRVGG